MNWTIKEKIVIRRALREMRKLSPAISDVAVLVAKEWGISLDIELTPQEAREQRRDQFPHRFPRRGIGAGA